MVLEVQDESLTCDVNDALLHSWHQQDPDALRKAPRDSNDIRLHLRGMEESLITLRNKINRQSLFDRTSDSPGQCADEFRSQVYQSTDSLMNQF